MQMSLERKAFLAVVLGAIMAGSSGVFIKHMNIPASSIAFIRTAIPSLLLGSLMLIRGIRFFRGNYQIMLGASVLNALRLYFFFTAYIYTSIGNAVIISFTWPIFATIFSVLFLKENVSTRSISLLSLAFVGIVFVYADKPISFGNSDFIGMSAALCMATVHALAVIIFKKESQNYSRTEIIFYQNLVGAFAFLPFILINEPIPTQTDLIIASAHAILLGIFAFNFFFFGLKYLPASTTSMIAYIEIVSALLFGVFWMKESLSWNMLVGGGIILMTTALLRR